MYSFRIRFTLPASIRLGIEDRTWEMAPDVSLRALGDELPINEASRLALHGAGFDTREGAEAGGARWRDALQAGFARNGVGVDFGERTARGIATAAGLKMRSEEQGCRVLNDEPGLSVFATEPTPKFVHVSASAVKIPSVDRTVRAINVAYALGPHHTPRQSLAYDLYSASFFATVADARLLMLMMAVETLLDPADRPEKVRAHVQSLIDQTKAAGLPKQEKESILGSMQWLFQDSVSRAGQKLAATLEGRTYMDLPPEKFFKKCYTLRSRLAHGDVPRPSFEEVNMMNGPLEQFVGQLLCPKLLEAVPD